MNAFPKTIQSKQSWFILFLCAILFIGAYFAVKPAPKEIDTSLEYAEYENGKILQVVSDNTMIDEVSDNSARGEQVLIVEVTTGQYKGDQLQVYNYIGPLYGVPLSVGDSCTMVISTYNDGTITSTVYEYNRTIPLLIVIGLFFIATILVGGKKGFLSLISLTLTILAILFILFPALLKGYPTLLTTFCITTWVSLVSFTIISGTDKKSLCAFLGTMSGLLLALLFAIFAQSIMKINGLRIPDVEPLLQLRQTGTPIHLKHLLSAGIMISALGAIMDVAMSLSSSIQEVHLANPELSSKELFQSGMNIGKDIVGTMTNTLILAFIGSGLVLILYIYSMNLSRYQFLSSSYLAIEVISGISSSIGVILSVPITALIASSLYAKKS